MNIPRSELFLDAGVAGAAALGFDLHVAFAEMEELVVDRGGVCPPVGPPPAFTRIDLDLVVWQQAAETVAFASRA